MCEQTQGQRIVKMKMFVLLCLVGSVLSVSEAVPLHDLLEWPPGTTGALGNKEGFNSTTNSSMIPASSGLNATANAQWNGTTQAIQNNFGFPTSPTEKQTLKAPPVKPKKEECVTEKITWQPMKNRASSPTAGPSKSTEVKPKQEPVKITWHPMKNTASSSTAGPSKSTEVKTTEEPVKITWHPMKNTASPPTAGSSKSTEDKENPE